MKIWSFPVIKVKVIKDFGTYWDGYIGRFCTRVQNLNLTMIVDTDNNL